MSNKTPAWVLVAAISSVLFASSASGFPLTLSLDSGTSSLSLSGDAGGVSLEEQGPGSLVTSYFGTVTVDVDDPVNPTSIQFLSAAATANNSGNWLPNDVLGPGAGENQEGDAGDPAPANYGAFADGSFLGDALAAVRGLVFSIGSGVLPVVGSDFNSTQTFEVTAGIADSNVDLTIGTDTADSDPISGDPTANAAADGSYTVVGNIAVLIMPVAMTIVDPDFTLSFNGTLRGSGPIFGDMNGDLSVDTADASLFVQALVDLDAYNAHGFGVNAALKGDVDQSGTFDTGDLAAFSALLGGPASAAAAAAPEPGAATLLGIALAFGTLLRQGRQRQGRPRWQETQRLSQVCL